jgi:repressor LexA
MNYSQIESTPDRIKAALAIRKMKQIDLAFKTGIHKANISSYLSGRYTPKSDNLRKIAEALAVNLEWLSGMDVPMEAAPFLHNGDTDPISYISCGDGIEPIKYSFCLNCPDDSARDIRIMKGDTIYIKEQPIVENGEVAAVMKGKILLIRRVYIEKNSITLTPCNSAYKPLTYTDAELDDVKIIGKVVGFASIIE